MSHHQLVHLHTDEVSVVVEVGGPGPAVVLHWGAPLGPLTEPDLTALASGLRRPRANSTPDVTVPVAVLPEPIRGYAGRPGLRGHRDGAEDWTTSFEPTGVSWTGPRTVTMTAVDQRARLALATELELAPAGMLRVRHRIRNAGRNPYTLDGLEAALPVPAQARELLDLTGRWCRERHPQRRAWDIGGWVRESRRGRTGLDATLALLAGTAGFGFRHGEVWAVHVAWSGNHVSYAQRLPEGPALLGGGELLDSGEVILGEGEEYASPWLYAAYSGRGIDGISAAFHRCLRARTGHPGPDRPRPVVLNTWEAVYYQHGLDRLRTLANVAAKLGVERFVLDDGWFRGRRDDTAGLGDWYVDETVWPRGLTPLIDHVRRLGMDFGLWVEPEMVSPDSDLYRAHPDWVLRPHPDVLPPPSRNQQVLDLARPDAYEFVLSRLDALLHDHDIAYLKWDHNRDLVAAGHGRRPGVHAQTLATYRLLGDLRARHPSVEIESCGSGGGRIDLEILRYTDRVWASDCNDALERQTIQRWTALLVPPELIGAHVGPPRAHTTGRTQDLSFRVATALFGHLGIEWDVSAAAAEDQAALAEAIAFYKEMRELLHGGEVVRADHPDPAGWVHGVVAHDRRQAVYCYVQMATSDRAEPAAMRLPGLDPRHRYRVRVRELGRTARTMQFAGPPWMAQPSLVATGRVLAEVGIQPPILAPEQAFLVCVSSL